ncbi:hypothetical protein WDU94_002633 [Cyamophila willieti]
MISSCDTDLMGWNSPSNISTITAKKSTLSKPLLPTINEKSAKQCQNEENEINLLNLTIVTTVTEDVPNTKSPNSKNSSLSEDDILNISSLDDKLCDVHDNTVDDKLLDELQSMDITDSVTSRVNNNNNKKRLSQSQSDYRQINSSSVSASEDLNSSLDQIKHRSLPLIPTALVRTVSVIMNSAPNWKALSIGPNLCLRKSKTMTRKLWRLSSEEVRSFVKIEREESQKVEPATPHILHTKTTLLLQPLESPQLKLRSTTKLQRKLDNGVCGANGSKPRQGPMKAMAPLKSMVKSSNICPSKGTSSVPPLGCSTPEKHSTSTLSSRWVIHS